MKTKLIILIIVIIAAAALIFATSTEMQIGEKYQYRFWQQDLEFENNKWYSRVLFSYSHDYGNSFSEPKDVSMTEQHAHEPKMILMDDDVLLVWRDEVPNNSLLSFAKSSDHGETFEKKRLFQGARPDIIHYSGVLYLAWADLENRRVLYSTSDDGGEIFSEHTIIFAPTGQFSPYANKPTPKLAIDQNNVKISWSMLGEDYEHVIGVDEPVNLPVEPESNDVILQERFKDKPEVVAFYARYVDVEDYVQYNRVNFAAENDNFRARLSLYVDENNELSHMRFYCFVEGQLQHEVAQEDILHYLQNYHCLTYKTGE